MQSVNWVAWKRLLHRKLRRCSWMMYTDLVTESTLALYSMLCRSKLLKKNFEGKITKSYRTNTQRAVQKPVLCSVTRSGIFVACCTLPSSFQVVVGNQCIALEVLFLLLIAYMTRPFSSCPVQVVFARGCGGACPSCSHSSTLPM